MEDLKQRIEKIEKFIDSLKGTNNFPKEVLEALIASGFLKYEKSLNYEAGASGNAFEDIIVKYGKYMDMIGIKSTPLAFVVNSLPNDTCSLIDYSFDISKLNGASVQLYTDGILPGGLDLVVPMFIMSASGDSFKFTTDGINPVDITSVGTGNQYIGFW